MLTRIMASNAAHDDRVQERLSNAIGDRYEVLERVGGGGMADVYLARHRLHGGFCAVKVLADHLARDESVVARFLQEAQTAAGLEGRPNIVRIVDIGHNNGLYYLIMPYVEGEDLEAQLERSGRLTPEEAAYVVREVARGLAGAHAQGVVHRDLKPANVRLDPEGRVTVLDFGIAKAGGPSSLTQAGDRLGTSYYMAPEQIRGEPIDHRADLYSLGVVFYELLTGERPFTGETHHAIELQHVNEPAPDPSEADPSIPQDLADVVLYLMEKSPHDRYQSAEAVVDVLAPYAPAEAPPSLRAASDGRLQERAAEAPTPDPGAFTAPRRATPSPGAAQGPIVARAPATAGRKRSLAIVGIGLAAAALIALALVVIPSDPDPDPEPGPATGGSETPDQPVALEPPEGMVLVPAGNFRAGDPDPEAPNPLRSVYLDAFFIDRTEVTNAQYKEFCDATGHAAPDPPPWSDSYFTARPNYPVVNVSFDDAEAYAQWAGKRLPTEEEWEKAARGDDGRLYPWGMTPPTAQQANVEGTADRYGETAPADAFAAGAGPSGAVNLIGNVWEWTVSSYPVTPQEQADMRSVMRESSDDWRVLKGGSFVLPAESQFLHAYQRRGSPRNGSHSSIGFRCVKDAR